MYLQDSTDSRTLTIVGLWLLTYYVTYSLMIEGSYMVSESPVTKWEHTCDYFTPIWSFYFKSTTKEPVKALFSLNSRFLSIPPSSILSNSLSARNLLLKSLIELLVRWKCIFSTICWGYSWTLCLKKETAPS